jgi:hypothetical protein
VVINESVGDDRAAAAPGAQTPVVRDVWWEGDADSHAEAVGRAVEAAPTLRREKHGEELPAPTGLVVSMERLDAA